MLKAKADAPSNPSRAGDADGLGQAGHFGAGMYDPGAVAAQGIADGAQPPADLAAGHAHALDTDGGAPLAADVRAGVEQATGGDLGGARVHCGPSAAAQAEALGARAYTVGADIHLGAGESASDTRLMAHEATHVAQQAGGPPVSQSKSFEVVPESDPAETQADRVADAVVSGRAESIGALAPVRGGTAARAPKANPAPPTTIDDFITALDGPGGSAKPGASPAAAAAAKDKPAMDIWASPTFKKEEKEKLATDKKDKLGEVFDKLSPSDAQTVIGDKAAPAILAAIQTDAKLQVLAAKKLNPAFVLSRVLPPAAELGPDVVSAILESSTPAVTWHDALTKGKLLDTFRTAVQKDLQTNERCQAIVQSFHWVVAQTKTDDAKAKVEWGKLTDTQKGDQPLVARATEKLKPDFVLDTMLKESGFDNLALATNKPIIEAILRSASLALLR